MSTILTLSPLLPVCQFVYDYYLSKPYTDAECLWDWTLDTERGTIQRPNHGLAHSMRVAQLVPVVANFLHTHTKEATFDLTPKQIQLLQIAALFSVVGRENEMGFSENQEKYSHFRLNSAIAFEQFIRTAFNLTEAEIRHYTNIVHKMGSPNEQSAEFKILDFSHKLDLLRCYSSRQIQEKLVTPLSAYLPESETQVLLNYAEHLLHATGNRVYTGKNPTYYNTAVFGLVSTNPRACVDALFSVDVPEPRVSSKMRLCPI